MAHLKKRKRLIFFDRQKIVLTFPKVQQLYLRLKLFMTSVMLSHGAL